MPQQTPAAARAVDPILTNHVRGYTNAEHVGNVLFPFVPVETRGAQRIEFGRESFKRYNSRRAPGSATKRVSFGHSTQTIALHDHSLEGEVPIELQQEAMAVPKIDKAKDAVNGISAIMSLEAEIEQAEAATNTAVYASTNKVALSGNSQWSDHSNSTPTSDVEDAREAVRSQIGIYPNTMVVGPKVWSQLKWHPKLVEHFKYTGRDSITPEMLASLWEIDRIVVGKAVYMDEAEVLHDVWGRNVVMAYTNPTPNRFQPSFGYTHRLKGYQVVETPYYDNNTKTWYYPQSDCRSVDIVGADAGFLISSAVAEA